MPRAAVHAGGVSLVEQGGGHPGQQERHPASQHDQPHLGNIALANNISTRRRILSDLEFGEELFLSVEINQLDCVSGHHARLRGHCQP